ncbi:hypothetical protein A2344_03985 [Candidatus Peregrinibacteria bacterium RIFOXYB12_FULL_41_12]|nr:MAG: hypothetical protein A2244_01150 [Candidatus Peregrinibacteria bacterium RIFOXYA2_FULL_41_18]OGJ48265.1 MAG: hypothetical protein A2344_03985 [Candidatus Peregrinibacteria bacterium RIFOXYB12_FULL_41_12]OGJ52250.1 MAG: hypothetical protein A2336_05275 [Candidatus Peregrinibacteria bacterium RIFOXYB2_FULL_41_88]OGJ52934.1 MAG: hypothetical protein A2448_00625 [Candidatus Peregrinibacteria bacterium RIFOXYC2_FULL_41_22]
MNYAFNALSRRALTEFEMRDKLLKRYAKIQGSSGSTSELSVDQDIIADVCSRLRELNLINDEKYLENFISTKTNLQAIGKFGVFNKLRGKGISKEIFDRVWESSDISESAILDRACEDFERKKGAINGSQKQKERLMRYLAARGLPPALIYKKIREGLQEE